MFPAFYKRGTHISNGCPVEDRHTFTFQANNPHHSNSNHKQLLISGNQPQKNSYNFKVNVNFSRLIKMTIFRIKNIHRYLIENLVYLPS